MTEFKISNKKIFKLEKIWNSKIYIRESKNHLLKLYYLVFWKNYLNKRILKNQF